MERKRRRTEEVRREIPRRTRRRRPIAFDSDDETGSGGTTQSRVPPHSDSESRKSSAPSSSSSRSCSPPPSDDSSGRSKKRKKKGSTKRTKRRSGESSESNNNNDSASQLEELLQQSDAFTAKLLARSRGYGTSSSSTSKRGGDSSELIEAEAPTRLTVQPSSITGGKLKPYQLEGLNWLIQLYETGLNGILADEMGLGKTLQTISLLAFLKEFKDITGPHLILCPKSTLGNWYSEINRFCPSLRAFKFQGSKEERQEQIAEGWLNFKKNKTDIIITSFELCLKEQSAFRHVKWKYLIVDEAHRIKNEASKLSLVIRQFRTDFRLLLTGTPLQNNLRELWALLNFLFPEMFASGDEFERTFDLMATHHADGRLLTTEEKTARNAAIVSRLHKILKPFLLRRVKSEVMVELPPKKELLLYVPLTAMQRDLYRTLLARNVDAITDGQAGGKVRLLNLAMQLRKACNHPYLFDGFEDRTADVFGEHLVTNSGKMMLLDRMLQRLISKGSRILIFSQMTAMLDILEDYCRMRAFPYCRIDGSTSSEDRDRQLEEFNAPDSPLKVFLLSTRAGGLGINLATADTVVIYDSDWNPQVDLQAMDRAHRIGQRKPVSVFRLAHEHTIEEKVIERALLKLRLDTVVIQHGRLAGGSQQSAGSLLSKGDLMRMVQYGADKIYQSKELNDLTEEDVEEILARGEKRTAELSGKLDAHASRLSLLNFDVSNSNLYEFEGVDYNAAQQRERAAWANLGVSQLEDERLAKRRVRVMQEQQQLGAKQQQAAAAAAAASPVVDRKGRVRLLRLEEWQFFDRARLLALHEIEVHHALSGGATPDLTEEEKEEKVRLMSEGFGNWSRKDFLAFIRACELHGSSDFRLLAREVGKPEGEVERYAKVFQERYREMLEGEKFMKRVLAGNDVAAKHKACALNVIQRLATCPHPWRKISSHPFPKAKSHFSDDEDLWLLNAAIAVGYGNWDALQEAAERAPAVMFNWFLRSRTGADLAKRVDFLAKQVQKELQDETSTRSKAAAQAISGERVIITSQGDATNATNSTVDATPTAPYEPPFPPVQVMYGNTIIPDAFSRSYGTAAKRSVQRKRKTPAAPQPDVSEPTSVVPAATAPAIATESAGSSLVGASTAGAPAAAPDSPIAAPPAEANFPVTSTTPSSSNINPDESANVAMETSGVFLSDVQ